MKRSLFSRFPIDHEQLPLRLHDALKALRINVAELHADGLAGRVRQLADDRTLGKPRLCKPADRRRVGWGQAAATQIGLSWRAEHLRDVVEHLGRAGLAPRTRLGNVRLGVHVGMEIAVTGVLSSHPRAHNTAAAAEQPRR